MRKAVLVLLALAIAVPTFALEGSDVAYWGGTIPQLKAGMAGKLDLTGGTGLMFVYMGGSLEIPYDRIESYGHSEEVAVHLGVAPAIAVGLVKRRRRNHFVRITYSDAENRHQVVVFEVPKTMPQVLMPVLGARAPQARCGPSTGCGSLFRPITPTPKIEPSSKSGDVVVPSGVPKQLQ